MNKADTSRIRATCENAPVINQNSSFADACKCSEALTEILELTAIARDAGQEEPERNGDGDTLEDIKAVWGEFGKRSIEFSLDKRTEWAFATGSFNFTLNRYRITAKHADRFDPKCMSLEVWARAAIGRGEIKRERNGCIEIYDTFSNGYLHGRRCMPTSGHKVDYRITFAIHDHSTWTAIPRAEAPAGERESENPEPCALCGKPSTHICHCPQCMDMLELDGDNPDAGRALCDECGNDQCKPPSEAPAAGNDPLAGACGAQHDSRAFHHCLLPAGHEGRHFCHICGIYWDSVEPPPAKDAPIDPRHHAAFAEAYTRLRVALSAIGITHEGVRWNYREDEIPELSARIFEANKVVKYCRELTGDVRNYEQVAEEYLKQGKAISP